MLGSVNGALNLNAQLNALEQDGSVKVLSTPRVTTQNNIPAEITQGAQIPIQVVSNNTVTVNFKDAALTLARDAADHRLEHGDHEHLPRERDAELHARPARRSRFRRSTRSAP